MIEAGAYRDRVLIQTRTATSGPLGASASAWEDLETRWCRIIPISVQLQLVLAQRGHTNVKHKLALRGTLEIDIANTRFVIGERYYRAAEPPDVDVQGRHSTVLIEQEVQRVR